MALAAPPISRHIPTRRIGAHEEMSRVSAFLMLSLVIVGLAGLTMVVQAAQAPSVRADRPARAISPSVGAPPAPQPSAPSANEQPAQLVTTIPAAPPETAPSTASASTQAQVAAGAADAPLTVGTAARVVNTDGLGVILYGAPRSGARTPRGLLEGARVTVIEASGPDWARVRAPNGLDGWVPARYVAADR